MATGANDANGIWQYGEDDSNTTFSALLNRLGASTSTAVGLIKNNAKGTIAATSGGTNGLTYSELSTNLTVASNGTSDVFSISFTGIANRRYKATVTAFVDHQTAGGRYSLNFTDGAGAVLRTCPDQVNTSWARQEKTQSYIFTATGATTLKVRFSPIDGIGYLYGTDSALRSKFIIEDIGAA